QNLTTAMYDFSPPYQASGSSNLGDVAAARGDWPAALVSYRQAISLVTGQDTSQTLVKSIVDEEIRRYRETFVGLCRAAWETRDQAGIGRGPFLCQNFRAVHTPWLSPPPPPPPPIPPTPLHSH